MPPRATERAWMVALGAIASLAAGCVAERPASVRRDGIVDGADSFEHDAVVALRQRRARCPQGHEVETFCTGVLIAPRVVLTSAHCLTDRDVDRLEVFFGQDVLYGGTHVGVAQALAHPAYDAATRANDLALIALADDAPAAPIALAAIDPESLAVGTALHVVGFGATGPGGDVGTRRAGTSVLERVDETTFRYGPGPALTCEGDSGGPVLIDDGEGGHRVLGITRSGDRACAVHGIATRIDAYLESFVRAFADAPPIERPRALPDVSADFCAADCESDLECPSGMRCLFERSRRRCGYPEVRVGVFGAECGSDAECGGEPCVAVGEGAAQDCRCFDACAPEDAPGASCAARGGARGGRSETLLALAATLLLVRRRSRDR